MEEVERIFAKLPPEARRELLDYAEFLLQKYGKREIRGLSLHGKES